jgi:hypothetical protein
MGRNINAEYQRLRLSSVLQNSRSDKKTARLFWAQHIAQDMELKSEIL